MTVSAATTSGEILTSAYLNNNINSGLTLVSTTTIGTTVSSVVVSGAFSATYDNYLIKITGGVCSASTDLRLQLGSTISGYKTQLLFGSYNNTASAEGSTTSTAFRYCGNGDTTGFDAHADVMSPFLAKHTKFLLSEFASGDAGPSFGLMANTTSYTAFTILASTGTMTGGTITVYGYRKA